MQILQSKESCNTYETVLQQLHISWWMFNHSYCDQQHADLNTVRPTVPSTQDQSGDPPSWALKTPS